MHVLENRANEKVSGACIKAEDAEDDNLVYEILGNGTNFFSIDENGCLTTLEDAIDRLFFDMYKNLFARIFFIPIDSLIFIMTIQWSFINH